MRKTIPLVLFVAVGCKEQPLPGTTADTGYLPPGTSEETGIYEEDVPQLAVPPRPPVLDVSKPKKQE